MNSTSVDVPTSPQTKEFSISLAAGITVALALGLSCVLVLAGWLLDTSINGKVTSIMTKERERDLEGYAQSAGLPLWNFDTEQIKAIIDNIATDDSIVAAGVFDSSSGKVIYSIDKEQGAVKTADPLKDHSSRVKLKKDIIFSQDGKNKTLGNIFATFEYSGIAEQVHSTTKDLAVIVGGMLIAVIGVVFMIVNHIVKPVTRLTKKVMIIAQDPSSTEIVAVSSTIVEVKRLVDSLGILQKNYAVYQGSLVDAKNEAERASQAKSEFLANMSHELRTPLNSIIGLTEIVKGGTLAQDQREMLQTIEESSSNLLVIVNDILDISKIESGHLVLENIVFDVKKSVSRVINMLVQTASKKGLLLQYTGTDAEFIHVKGDPVRFVRVVTNLVGNAIKYTEAGKVTVWLRTSSSPDGSLEVALDVIDTGIGIPEEKLDSVFEKFVQADTSTTRKYGGSGLGLAITKQIVLAMNGKIGVKSVVGKGSTFWVTIPFIQAGENERPAAELDNQIFHSAASFPAAGVRILIAEDHALNQAFMKRFLPSLGLKNFTIVDNGLKACDAARGDDYDMILMDCHMPEMNGHDATRAIRAQEKDKGRRIPIIAMTANAMAGERERCLECGMDDYITKPVDRQKFIAVISRWVMFDAAPDKAKEEKVIETEPPTLDMSIIRTFSEGDIEMEKEFAEIFSTQSVAQIARLKEHIVDGHCDPWKEIAHMLKGGSATIGAMKMREICARAQDMLVSTADDRSAILASIEEEFAQVCAELRKINLIT